MSKIPPKRDRAFAKLAQRLLYTSLLIHGRPSKKPAGYRNRRGKTSAQGPSQALESTARLGDYGWPCFASAAR